MHQRIVGAQRDLEQIALAVHLDTLFVVCVAREA
jgi:hypothetical protein